MSLKNWKPLFWDTVQHFLHPTHTVLHHHIREGRVKEASRLNNSQTNAVWGLQPRSSATGELPHRQSCYLAHTHTGEVEPELCCTSWGRYLPPANRSTQRTQEKILLLNDRLQLCDQTWNRMRTPQKLSWRSHKHDRNRIILWSGYKKLGNPWQESCRL